MVFQIPPVGSGLHLNNLSENRGPPLCFCDHVVADHGSNESVRRVRRPTAPKELELFVLLPNAGRAVIDPVKLHGYLLSTTHPIGRFKARFFAALGFVAERWSEFATALRAQHLVSEAEAGSLEPHGQFFTIRAMLKGPTGASAVVVSVWLVQTGEDHPRFVTAYPGGAK